MPTVSMETILTRLSKHCTILLGLAINLQFVGVSPSYWEEVWQNEKLDQTMPTNFGQCYVKHFYRSKNLSGMGILVENFKAISQESSLLEHLVSVVRMSYRISIEVLTVNNIYQKQSAICCSFFWETGFRWTSCSKHTYRKMEL